MQIRNTSKSSIAIAGVALGPHRTVELTNEQFQGWLNAGSANRDTAAAHLRVEVPDPPRPPRGTVIREAIDKLDTEDPLLWTKAGPPELGALRRASGLSDVTGAERDTAWREFNAQSSEAS